MDERADFLDALLESPLGVCWLAVLETGPGDRPGRPMTSLRSTPSTVAAAVERVRRLPLDSLLASAVDTGLVECGPWMPGAPATVAAAYRQAVRRAPIAGAIADRVDELTAPLDRTTQQWFTDCSPGLTRAVPRFQHAPEIGGAGEIAASGLWTASAPEPAALFQMVGAWEYETGQISRWSLPVRSEARIYEIDRPADWARLVLEHPAAVAQHPSWELPGPNQRRSDVAPLLALARQAAVRTTVRRHLVPDWASVAERYDGVHLSWAGFITSEGRVIDLGDGDVTMLRYWFSERTLWLADVFGEPQPTPDPQIDLASGQHHHPPRPPRIAVDAALIRRLLGR